MGGAPPTDAADDASGPRWTDVFLELPPRKRQRIAVGVTACTGALKNKYIDDPIRMIKATMFARYLKTTRDFEPALDAARDYDRHGMAEPEPAPPETSKAKRSTLDEAKARVNVVWNLLGRRRFHADRLLDLIIAINLWSDASPNCGLEFQGMVCGIWT